MTALILIHTQLPRLLFSKIEANVMTACEAYLWIMALFMPFPAVYDARAALCRSSRKTNVTMNFPSSPTSSTSLATALAFSYLNWGLRRRVAVAAFPYAFCRGCDSLLLS